MSTTKDLFLNTRMIILIVALVMALIAINPQFDTSGVAIRGIVKDSAAAFAAIEAPKDNTAPTALEVIKAIDNQPIETLADYHRIVSSIGPNESFTVQSDRGFYTLFSDQLLNTTVIGQENRTVSELIIEDINGTSVNRTVNITKPFNITTSTIIGVKDIGIKVSEVPSSNLIKGLDLAGGARVLLQPETPLSPEDLESLMGNLQVRLNVFGLTDVIVRSAEDLDGNQFVIVEIAGASEDEVRSLISKQGKFEAQISNQTVFRGGEDITYVCRTADCSGIDPNTGCVPSGDGYSCRFQFQISLTPESAARQASVTSQIPIQPDGQYLTEPLILFLDDEEVDSLQISTGLRGRAETDISISGSGAGASQELAIEETLKNIKRLQTILITGSLPVKLNVVQTKSLSASLGEEFLRNALWMGLVSVAIVALILFVRYRRFIVSLPVLACMLMEVFLTLGFAALFRWNMDLSSIAGLIVTVGTGVHDQLVITDELLEGGAAEISSNWKDKIKSAFGIVFTAYGAIMVAMIPLLFASAGLLKGFALTTMAGVSFGVFITRPAFAKFIEVMLKR